MDYLGKVDGEPFDGGKGEDMSVEIGTGRLIPGFEDQLLGVKAGDEKQISVRSPKITTRRSLPGSPRRSTSLSRRSRPRRRRKRTTISPSRSDLKSLDKLRELFKGQVDRN